MNMTQTYNCLIIGAGISGAAIGLLMAEIIHTCENGHDHDHNPVKVKLPNIEFRLDTGIFSRNREVIEGSTFSVLG